MNKIYQLTLVISLLANLTKLYARTGLILDPNGGWANILISSQRIFNLDEKLCGGTEALIIYDSLKVRAEAGHDEVLKRTNTPLVKIKCENVSGFGFVNCSFSLNQSASVSIDTSDEKVSAIWTGEDALILNSLWDHTCYGSNFSSNDQKFKMHFSPQKVEMSYLN